MPDTEQDTSQVFGKRFVRKLMLPVGFAVIVYAALLFYGDMFAILGGLRAFPVEVVLWALLVSAGSFAVRAVRWHFYLGTMKIKVPVSDSILLFLSGLGMSITPGKAGELLKSLLLKERHDVPVARSGPIVIAERLTDLGALVLLALGSLLWPRSPLLVVVLGAVLLLSLFAFGRSERLGNLAVSVVCLVPFARRHREKLTTAHASLRELWTVTSFTVAMLLSIGAWALQAVTVILFTNALGVHSLGLPGALIAYAAPLLAGTLALLPGGLGLTEASMAGTLQALAGVGATAATTITILTRLVTFWLAIVIGFGALGIWRVSRRGEAPRLVESRDGAS